MNQNIQLTPEELTTVHQHQGSHDVAWLQKWLRDIAGQPLQIDGIGGSLTRAAFISAFANKNAAAITTEELIEIAHQLGDSSIQRIQAVAKVESAGSGWFNSGLPKILYERHKFYKWLPQAQKITDWITNPKAGGYTTDANRNHINDSWEKLSHAVCRNPLAALKSISIGKFQVLGEYYAHCGYTHPIWMLWAARNSEAAHYEMLRDYILNVSKLKQAFLALSTNPETCRDFAKGYNGPAYTKNAYHTKLAQAMQANR